MEVYSERTFSQRGISCRFVQDNHSLSREPFTLRGIHFQCPPHGQDKLVRCTRGRILDVAVDLRDGSPSFGRWVTAELSADNGDQLFIPVGFGHAFLTLEPNCEVSYKVSDIYAPDCDAGIRWNDPLLAINWPIATSISPELSEKDAQLPGLADFISPFPFDGRPLLPLV